LLRRVWSSAFTRLSDVPPEGGTPNLKPLSPHRPFALSLRVKLMFHRWSLVPFKEIVNFEDELASAKN
jgi:hypothetical protein